MTETNDTEDRKPGMGGRKLNLRRSTTETIGRVRQNFSHGRTKPVVVETKRKRTIAQPGKPQEPSPQPQRETRRPEAAPRPEQRQPARPGMVLRTLTDEEKGARERALVGARVREAEDRKRAEEEARHRAEEEQRGLVERVAAEARKAEEESRRQSEVEQKRRAHPLHR